MAGAPAQKAAVAVIVPVPLKMQNPSRVDPGKLNFVCAQQFYKRKNGDFELSAGYMLIFWSSFPSAPLIYRVSLVTIETVFRCNETAYQLEKGEMRYGAGGSVLGISGCCH